MRLLVNSMGRVQMLQICMVCVDGYRKLGTLKEKPVFTTSNSRSPIVILLGRRGIF